MTAGNLVGGAIIAGGLLWLGHGRANDLAASWHGTLKRHHDDVAHRRHQA